MVPTLAENSKFFRVLLPIAVSLLCKLNTLQVGFELTIYCQNGFPEYSLSAEFEGACIACTCHIAINSLFSVYNCCICLYYRINA